MTIKQIYDNEAKNVVQHQYTTYTITIQQICNNNTTNIQERYPSFKTTVQQIYNNTTTITAIQQICNNTLNITQQYN